MLLTLVLCAGFLALGTWQVERRTWKLALIAAVDARVRAPAADAPGPSGWPAITRESAPYRHVQVTGRFLAGHDTLVQATTERGAGHWVLTPLRTTAGWMVLVNRGFLATPRGNEDAADGGTGANSAVHAPVAALGIARPAAPPGEQVTVAGLLRITEPGGAFLRHNAPEDGRWYSRDVAAIGSTLGLPPAEMQAPYFIDAEAGANGSQPLPSNGRSVVVGHASEPIGGMTVINFHNSHLLYAITWYTLALMSAWATWRVSRPEEETPSGEGDADVDAPSGQNTR